MKRVLQHLYLIFPPIFQMYNNLIGSPHSSISNDDVDSDPGDPIHNDSILNELFYKQMVSMGPDKQFLYIKL